MLFVLARAILLRVPDLDDASLAVWYADTNNQRLLVLAVNLTTIGSIAFLWFVAVIRRRVGLRENRFFGTVFVGVALLMAALWVIGVLMFTAPGLDAYTFATPRASIRGGVHPLCDDRGPALRRISTSSRHHRLWVRAAAAAHTAAEPLARLDLSGLGDNGQPRPAPSPSI